MALKYYFEYIDLKGILHRCDIEVPNYTDDPIEVTGYAELTAGSVTDALECIRGTGLKLFLDASVDRKYEELYLVQDDEVKVTYVRDSITEFIGFLNPEGMYEDYVSDKWTLSLLCADGLSFLKNKAYVNNETGENFTGKQTELNIISNCLRRTGLELDINTSIGLGYHGMNDKLASGATYNVLTRVYLNSERFLKDADNSTTMSCDEVLRTVLEKYNAVPCFYQGSWHIYRPIDLFANETRTFFTYNSFGSPSTSGTKEVNLRKIIGSNINGFYPCWAENNQQKRVKNSVGAQRIHFSYGVVRNVVENSRLLNTGNGFTSNPYTFDVPNWRIVSQQNIGYATNDALFPQGDGSVRLDGIAVSNNTGTIIVLESEVINVFANDQFKVTFIQKSGNTSSTNFYGETNQIAYRVRLTDRITTYYLKKDGSWTTSVEAIDLPTRFVSFDVFHIETQAIPVSGEMIIQIQDCKFAGFVYISEISLRAITEARGETHTHEKILNPSSKIPPVKKVFIGDVVSDLYLGTMYKADQTTPTTVWYREGRESIESMPVLRLMGIDYMTMYFYPYLEFTGSIYGYIPYLSSVVIDGIEGVFVIIEYSYNIKRNVTNLKLIQINGERDSGLYYDYEQVYSDDVPLPTIRG